MKAISYPFTIDVQGRLGVATTYDQIVKGQLIDVLMTNFMERVMRPTYGSDLRSALFDPTDELVRGDAATQVATRVGQWAPRVILQSLKFKDDDLQPGTVFVDVLYRVGVFDQATQLKLPVSRFLTEESVI